VLAMALIALVVVVAVKTFSRRLGGRQAA
jgi:hypothetical protein